MSHYIEDDQVAITLPMTEYLGNTSAMLLVCLGGDNNCTQQVERSRRYYEVRARDWSPVAFAGSSWDAMRQVVLRASDCEGGMLVLAGGARPTLPEAYIRRWRAAVGTPVTLADVRAAGITIEARLVVEESQIQARHVETIAELCLKKPDHQVDGPKRTFTFDLDNPDDVLRIWETYWIAERSPYRFFKVRGSRDAVVRRLAQTA